ncbi:hypothetical protein ACVWXX_000249 [Bacillus toyonensis]
MKLEKHPQRVLFSLLYRNYILNIDVYALLLHAKEVM